VLIDQDRAVGVGPDAFVADVRGRSLEVARRLVEEIVPRNATLAVLPEGLMLNYLTRRPNPGPYTSLMPPEMAMFGDADISADIQANPPDYVALVHRDTSEYGVPLFGRDYGQAVASWIRQHYDEVVLVGDRPLENPAGFGILLLRRRPQRGS
jgi:hypothetical protein